MELIIESTKPIQGVMRIRIGETFFPTLVWRDSITKRFVNWDGYTASCTITMPDPDANPLSVDITLGDNGVMQFLISDTDTTDLTPGNGLFKIMVTDSLQRKSTWVEGVCRVF